MLSCIRCALVAMVLLLCCADAPQAQLLASYNYYYFDYREDLPRPYKSRESGWLPGVHINLEMQNQGTRFTPGLEFFYARARTVYDGTLQDGTPLIDATDNTFIRFEGDLAYLVADTGRQQWSIYSGWGYNVWYRRLGGPTPYVETYSWYQLPVGFRIRHAFSPELSATLDAALLIMFGGNIHIRFSQLGMQESMTLGNRPGWRIKLPLTYRLSDTISVGITPWYRFSAIGESDTGMLALWDNGTLYTMAIREPASETHQFGVQLGVDITL